MTIHGDQVKTPYELCSGRKPDLSRLRTFGCGVYVEPPSPRRPAKSEQTYVLVDLEVPPVL
jgi:hypothetical protein